MKNLTRRFGLGWAPVFLCLLQPACDSSPRAVFTPRKGGEVVFKLEVADTPAKRTLGLKYRRKLRDDQGMVFVFPDERIRTFWMKDTPLRLDMIFINRRFEVVGIIHQAIPFSTRTLSVPFPSQFVVEIKGGLSKKYGIEIGDPVRFIGIP